MYTLYQGLASLLTVLYCTNCIQLLSATLVLSAQNKSKSDFANEMCSALWETRKQIWSDSHSALVRYNSIVFLIDHWEAWIWPMWNVLSLISAQGSSWNSFTWQKNPYNYQSDMSKIEGYKISVFAYAELDTDTRPAKTCKYASNACG